MIECVAAIIVESCGSVMFLSALTATISTTIHIPSPENKDSRGFEAELPITEQNTLQFRVLISEVCAEVR